jgi:glycosyltransferase involved in cell wall biosynthesis
MLSVLIPVFNTDVRELVIELKRQCSELPLPFEIRLIDDGSEDKFKQINREISQLEHIEYSELERNIGRSAIRNKLAFEAKYEWLWFLDCDGDARVNPHLAKTFWENKGEEKLLSGGRIYQPETPDNKKLQLHWIWGSERELLDPQARMKNPANAFLSNNFILHKSLIEKIPFDTMLFGYGYEDTLFATELLNSGYTIAHINNPVLHAGLEPNDVFLKKIEESLHNLIRLKDICKEKNIEFPVKSKLVLAAKILRLPLIKQLIGSWFIRNENIWKIQLLGPQPSLRTFDAYRLAVLLRSY